MVVSGQRTISSAPHFGDISGGAGIPAQVPFQLQPIGNQPPMKKPKKKTYPASYGEPRDAARPPIFRLPTDVLQEIFRFLDQRSCFRVARSCKQFKEPALDQLWSEITTLTAPLALLDELINTNNGWMFCNGLGRVDWPKYWSYADRVRGVHITDDLLVWGHTTKFRINPQALAHALAATTSQIGHGALLPKVRALAFDFHQPSGPTVVLPLISPAVRHIAIKIPKPSEEINQAVTMVISTLTSMSCTLKLEQFDVVIIDDVTFGFGQSRREADSRRTLESTITRFIASQSTLQCLRVRPLNSLSSLTKALHVLRYLRVLEVICTSSSHNPPPIDNITFLGSCTDLEQLRIQGPSSQGQHAFSLIQPLLSCTRLTTLDLSWLGVITLNTANVEEMGKAWVNLKSLRFSLMGNGIPVDLLLTFAASFSSSLHSLAMPLDVSKIESIFPMTADVPCHDLKELFPGFSIKESHVQPFAELLGTIFRPGCRVISGNGSDDPNRNAESLLRSNQVNTLLSLIWRVQELARQRLENELRACNKV